MSAFGAKDIAMLLHDFCFWKSGRDPVVFRCLHLTQSGHRTNLRADISGRYVTLGDCLNVLATKSYGAGGIAPTQQDEQDAGNPDES